MRIEKAQQDKEGKIVVDSENQIYERSLIQIYKNS